MKYAVVLAALFSVCGSAAASGGCSPQRQLDQTPTWAVASVSAIIIIISMVWEHVLHKACTWFAGRHKKALFDALEKVKSELMILGFISLLLTFGQSYASKICIPRRAADTMLPCPYHAGGHGAADFKDDESSRKLLSVQRRALSADSTATCKEGHGPLISVDGLHQLHILIFFLAFFHVIYSFITMSLGRLKIRGWKHWEHETLSHDYEFTNDPSRFRLSRETSFVKLHTSFWTKLPVFFYIGCFCRQFFRSVTKADYLTLRNGFINVHLAPGSKFDFQKYIKRSLEDDFKVVVGVSPVLWASFVVFLLLNVKGWQALFWASVIPVIIILAVGTKLQVILTQMAVDITERHAVVQGMPLVNVSDKYFWFGSPPVLLHLIHFALFQNAFQITYFLWIWYSFGLRSCFHANFTLAWVKVAIGIAILLLCSYITLPLYALVTQMGSFMKKSIFDEQTSRALRRWHMAVKRKHDDKGVKSPTHKRGASPNASPARSSTRTMHRIVTFGPSRSNALIEQGASDTEAEPFSPTPLENSFATGAPQATESISHDASRKSDSDSDFSFVKLAPP